MHDYETLTWPELDALNRARTVIFIPFSPLEEHGPHLPIGTDLMMARHFAITIAQRVEEQRPDLTALLLPSIPLGAGTVPMRGSINIASDLVYDVARQVGAAFIRDGFRHIIFVNGHLSAFHLIALENAAAWLSRHYHAFVVAPSAHLALAMIRQGTLATAIGDRIDPQALKELQRTAHAGMLETSVMLALRPQLVRRLFTQLPSQSRSAMLRWRGRTPAGWQGYIGDPALADAEWGKLAIVALADTGAELVLSLIAGDAQAARRAHIFPRVPFWLTLRRLRMQFGALGLGVAATLILAQVMRMRTRGDSDGV